MNTPRFPLRRAPKRFLEGAPDYVLDIFDNRGKTADRYTVIFGERFADYFSDVNWQISYLGLGDDQGPQGISMWGALSWADVCAYRERSRKFRTSWLSLPEHVRKHVIDRAEAPF